LPVLTAKRTLATCACPSSFGVDLGLMCPLVAKGGRHEAARFHGCRWRGNGFADCRENPTSRKTSDQRVFRGEPCWLRSVDSGFCGAPARARLARMVVQLKSSIDGRKGAPSGTRK